MGGNERQDRTAGVLIVLFLAALVALAVAPGCQTMEAVAELPEGYWAATEGLIMAFLRDLWDLVRMWM